MPTEGEGEESLVAEDRAAAERREGLFFISYDAFPELQELPLSERIVTAQPYCRLLLHRVLLCLLGVASGGLVFLLSIWFRRRAFFATHAKCDIQRATHLLLTAADGKQHVVRVEKLPFKKAALDAIPPGVQERTGPAVLAGRERSAGHRRLVEAAAVEQPPREGSSEKRSLAGAPDAPDGDTRSGRSKTELGVVRRNKAERHKHEGGSKEDGKAEGLEVTSEVADCPPGDGEPRGRTGRMFEGQKLQGGEKHGLRGTIANSMDPVISGQCSLSTSDSAYSEEEEKAEPLCALTEKKSRRRARNSFAWMFEYRCTRYILEDEREQNRALGSPTFRPLAFNVSFPPGRLRSWFLAHPPSPSLVALRRSLFGPSFIHVPVPSLFSVIMEEVLHPFYIFQILAVALWIWDEYIQYALAILFITATSTLVECTQTRRNLKRLRDLAAQKCSVVVQRSSWEEPESHLGKTDRGCSSHVCVAAGSLAARPERSADGGSSACSKAGSVLFKKRRRRVIRREEIDSADLVVGDVIEISNGMTLPCDAIVIRGTVVVTESCLTGESFPVLKTPLPDTNFLHPPLPGDEAAHKQRGLNLEQAAKHQLFAGTRVLSVRVSSSVSPSPQPRDLGARKTQAAAFLSSASSLSPEICSSTKLHRPGVTRTEEDERESAVQPKNRFEGHPEKSLATESFVSDAGQIPLSPGSSLAAVCRVGYATVQGQTVRRLLYPTKMRIDFEKDALKFVAILGLLACIGGVFTLIISILHRLPKKEIFLRVFDLFTDAVPPALPASMSVGLSVAVSRLYSLYKVYCTAPSRLGMGGYVRCLCFDKTGTLTEEGVRMAAILPSCHFCGILSTPAAKGEGFSPNVPKELDKRRRLEKTSAGPPGGNTRGFSREGGKKLEGCTGKQVYREKRTPSISSTLAQSCPPSRACGTDEVQSAGYASWAGQSKKRGPSARVVADIQCSTGCQLPASFLPFMLPNSIRTAAMWRGGHGGGGPREGEEKEKRAEARQFEKSPGLSSTCCEASTRRLQGGSAFDESHGELPSFKSSLDQHARLGLLGQESPGDVSGCSSHSSSFTCDRVSSSCCSAAGSLGVPFTSFSTAVPSRSPSPSPDPCVRADTVIPEDLRCSSSSSFSSCELSSSTASCCECVRHVARCMSVCHSLLRIGGELAGDPLELQMVTHTSCLLLDGEGAGGSACGGFGTCAEASLLLSRNQGEEGQERQVDLSSARGQISTAEATKKDERRTVLGTLLNGGDAQTETGGAEEEKNSGCEEARLRDSCEGLRVRKEESAKLARREEGEEERRMHFQESVRPKATEEEKKLRGTSPETREDCSGHSGLTESPSVLVNASGEDLTLCISLGMPSCPEEQTGQHTAAVKSTADDRAGEEEKRVEAKEHSLPGHDELDGVTVGILEEEQAAFRKLQSELEGGEEIEGLTFVLPPDPFVADRRSVKGALAICRRFEFDSSLQRMSVIVQDTESREFFVYCKGSTEALRKLCEPETLPEDLDDQLHRCSSSGYRVIALAARRLPVAPSGDSCGFDLARSAVSLSPSSERHTYTRGLPAWSPSATSYVRNLSRNEAEKGLTFLGLILFTNELKPESRAVVSSLLEAQCTVRIATGDHPLTSIAVARQCGLLGGVGIGSSEGRGEQGREGSRREGERGPVRKQEREEGSRDMEGGGDQSAQEWRAPPTASQTGGLRGHWRKGGEGDQGVRRTGTEEFDASECGSVGGGSKLETRESCKQQLSEARGMKAESDRSRFSSFFSLFRRENLGARTFRPEYRTRLLSEDCTVRSDGESLWKDRPQPGQQRRRNDSFPKRFERQTEEAVRVGENEDGEASNADPSRERTRLSRCAQQECGEGDDAEDEIPVVILGDVYTADGEPRVGSAEYLVWTLLPHDSLFSVGRRGADIDVKKTGGDGAFCSSVSARTPPSCPPTRDSPDRKVRSSSDGKPSDAEDTRTGSTRREDEKSPHDRRVDPAEEDRSPVVGGAVTSSMRKCLPSYSSFDLRELLASLTDVRQASLVVTGRAFRHLRRLQALTHMPFVEDCDQVIAQVRKQHQELQDRQEDQMRAAHRVGTEREDETPEGWRDEDVGLSTFTEWGDDLEAFRSRESEEDEESRPSPARGPHMSEDECKGGEQGGSRFHPPQRVSPHGDTRQRDGGAGQQDLAGEGRNENRKGHGLDRVEVCVSGTRERKSPRLPCHFHSPSVSGGAHRPMHMEEDPFKGFSRGHRRLVSEELRQKRSERRASSSAGRGVAVRKSKTRRRQGEDEAEQADAEDFSLDEEDLEAAGGGGHGSAQGGELAHPETIHRPPCSSPSEAARRLVFPPRRTLSRSPGIPGSTHRTLQPQQEEEGCLAIPAGGSQETGSHGSVQVEARGRAKGESYPSLAECVHRPGTAFAVPERVRVPSSSRNKKSNRGEDYRSIRTQRRPHSLRCARSSRHRGAMDFFLETSEGLCGHGGDLDEGRDCTSSSTSESEWCKHREGELGRGKEVGGRNKSGAFFSFLKWPLFRRQASVTEGESGMDRTWRRRGGGAVRRRRGSEGGRTQERPTGEGVDEGAAEFASFLSLKASRGRMRERAKGRPVGAREQEIGDSGKEEVEEQKLRAVVEALMFPGVAASLLHKQQREEAKGGEPNNKRTQGERQAEEELREWATRAEAGDKETGGRQPDRTLSAHPGGGAKWDAESIERKRWSPVTRKASRCNRVEKESRGFPEDELPSEDSYLLASDGGGRTAGLPLGSASMGRDARSPIFPHSSAVLKRGQSYQYPSERPHGETSQYVLRSLSRYCSPLLRPQANKESISGTPPPSFPLLLPAASLPRCSSSPPPGQLPSPVLSSQPWPSSLDSASRGSMHQKTYLGPEALVCLVQKQLEENKQKHHLFTPGEYLPVEEADHLPLSRVDCLPAFLQHAEQQREEEAACVFQPVVGEEADVTERFVGSTIHHDEEADAVSAAASAASALLWGGSSGVPDLLVQLCGSGAGEHGEGHERKEREEETPHEERAREEAWMIRSEADDEGDKEEGGSSEEQSARRPHEIPQRSGRKKEGGSADDSRQEDEGHSPYMGEEEVHESFPQRKREIEEPEETSGRAAEDTSLLRLPLAAQLGQTGSPAGRLFGDEKSLESRTAPSMPEAPKQILSGPKRSRVLSSKEQNGEEKQARVDDDAPGEVLPRRTRHVSTSNLSTLDTPDCRAGRTTEDVLSVDMGQESQQQWTGEETAAAPYLLSSHSEEREDVEGTSGKHESKLRGRQGQFLFPVTPSGARDERSSPSIRSEATGKHLEKSDFEDNSLSASESSRLSPSCQAAAMSTPSLPHPRSVSPLSVWEGMTLQLRVSHGPVSAQLRRKKKQADAHGGCPNRTRGGGVGGGATRESQDRLPEEEVACRGTEVAEPEDEAEREAEERSSFCFRMSLYEYVVRQTVVLCRASPQDKGEFVAALQQLPCDPFVAMCGDGTNDAVAIKQADIGISILSPGSMACERGSPLPAASSPSSSPPRTQTSRLPASCFSWRRGFRRGEESSYAAPLLSDYAGGERHDLPSGAPLDRTKYDSLTISSSASSPRRDSHPSRPCCASSPSSCSCQPGALRTSGKSPRQLCATEGSFRNEDGTPSGGPSRRRFFRPSLPFCSPSASRGSLSSPPAERQECERGTGAALASSFSSVSLWAAVQLLREGRCMIVNSFSTFKFIACYSVLQFTSVLLLYAQAGNLTDSQYMWIDLVTVLPLSVTLARTRAADGLSPLTPPRSLVSAPVLVSLLGQIGIQVFFQVFALLFLKSQSFYVPYSRKSSGGGGGESLAGYENTVVFLISSMQYVFACAAFSSSSYPWRKAVWTNRLCFGGMASILLVSVLFLTVTPSQLPSLLGGSILEPLSGWLHLRVSWLPMGFRIRLLQVAACNGILSILFETLVVRILLERHLEESALRKSRVNSPHIPTDRRKFRVTIVYPHEE